ncbi:NAD(P)H-dependent flavin oxidoreductase [Nocardioides caldifontis]|uniref:NAD(P)H-dependent flavin oxidoreductase n=1 Tax=Nocardioides caldifontis TaxID=2588938 RepID=UPI001EF03468|nr:nitronate monooxygenase [Nocardioides caldifontis]
MSTWLTDTLGIEVPLVQAPMARVSEGVMAAAVSAAGGLGMVGVGPTASREWVHEQARTAGGAGAPYGLGFMAWALERDPRPLEAALETDTALVSVSFGAFEEPLRRAKAAGKLVTTQVGNVAEARRAEQAGVDLVVARGREAGGHGRDEVSTLPLLQLVRAAADVPVVAAGGIANADGLAAVLAGGAVGAWVGTAFLCCRESVFPAAARQRLIAADDTATVYGRVFDVAQRAPWPREYGGRALRNRFFDEWVGHEDELEADTEALARYDAAAREGDFDVAVVYAGQGAALLTEETAAADVVASFARAGTVTPG